MGYVLIIGLGFGACLGFVSQLFVAGVIAASIGAFVLWLRFGGSK